MLLVEYELELECYQGPIGKLLELVQSKKFDITLVSLARVTDDFIQYIRVIEAKGDVHYNFIADFLVVASQLVLIKSKVLLPALVLEPDEEASIQNLEHQLKLYQELKATHDLFKSFWRVIPRMYARPFLRLSQPIFYPPPQLHPSHLRDSLVSVVDVFERQFFKTDVVEREVVHLEAKVQDLLERVRISSVKFSELRSSTSRSELVVLFLALLHLVKEERVLARQEEDLGDITVQRIE